MSNPLDDPLKSETKDTDVLRIEKVRTTRGNEVKFPKPICIPKAELEHADVNYVVLKYILKAWKEDLESWRKDVEFLEQINSML